MTFDLVRAAIAQHLDLDPAEITPETSFADLGILPVDSLDIIGLMMALEDAFDLEIEDREMQQLHTIHDVVAFIDSRS